MIYSQKGKITIEGNIKEISAELVIVVAEIYKKLLQSYNKDIAENLLMNIIKRGIG